MYLCHRLFSVAMPIAYCIFIERNCYVSVACFFAYVSIDTANHPICLLILICVLPIQDASVRKRDVTSPVWAFCVNCTAVGPHWSCGSFLFVLLCARSLVHGLVQRHYDRCFEALSFFLMLWLVFFFFCCFPFVILACFFQYIFSLLVHFYKCAIILLYYCIYMLSGGFLWCRN